MAYFELMFPPPETQTFLGGPSLKLPRKEEGGGRVMGGGGPMCSQSQRRGKRRIRNAGNGITSRVFESPFVSVFRLRRAENDQDDERGDIFFRVREEVEGLGMGNFSRCFSVFRNQKLLYKIRPLFLTYPRQGTVFLRHSSRLFDGFFPIFTGENRRRVSR